MAIIVICGLSLLQSTKIISTWLLFWAATSLTFFCFCGKVYCKCNDMNIYTIINFRPAIGNNQLAVLSSSSSILVRDCLFAVLFYCIDWFFFLLGFSKLQRTAKVNNDGPNNITNGGQLLVPCRRWIPQDKVIVINDGMLHMFTGRFHLMWMYSDFYISFIKIVGPRILFALLSIHNNQS